MLTLYVYTFVCGQGHSDLALNRPQGILHSVLSCRLTLHIYDFAKKELNAPQTGAEMTKTGLDFAEVTPSMMASQQTDTTRLPERGEGSSRTISEEPRGAR
jgi:hypothetical protein